MKKRQYFESMKPEQLENELRKLNEVAGRLHHEQKEHRQWIQEILVKKRAKEQLHIGALAAGKQQADSSAFLTTEEMQQINDIMKQQSSEWTDSLISFLTSQNGSSHITFPDGIQISMEEMIEGARNATWLNARSQKIDKRPILESLERFPESRIVFLFVGADFSANQQQKWGCSFGQEKGFATHLPIIHADEMTTTWQATVYGKFIASELWRRKQNLPQLTQFTSTNILQAMTIAKFILMDKINPGIINVAKNIRIEQGWSTIEKMYEFAEQNPQQWAEAERRFDERFTIEAPSSFSEAREREDSMTVLLLNDINLARYEAGAAASLINERRNQILSKKRMERIPKRTAIDPANVPQHLSHIDASVFATPGLITAMEAGKDIFLVKRVDFESANLSSSPLGDGITNDSLVTRERLAALLPNEPHDEDAGKEWVSGVVPSEVEIARTKLIQEFRKLDEKCTVMGIENTPYYQGWSLLRSAFDSIEWKNSINECESDGEHVQCIHNSDILSLAGAPQDRNVLFFSGQNASATWNLFDFLIKFNDVLEKKNAIDNQTSHMNYQLLHVMLLGKKYFDAQIDVRKNCQPAELSFDSLKGQPHRYLTAEQRLSRMVTRAWPLSTQEAYVRIGQLMHSRPSSAECNWEELIRVMSEAAKMKLEMAPIAIADQEHAWLREHLEMLDPVLLAPNPNITYTLPWGSSKAQFICRKEHLPVQFTNYVSADNENTLDLVVNLNLQDENLLEADAWVNGTLPSIEELERELFVQDFVTDKFFPSKKANDTAPASEETEPVAGDKELSGQHEDIPLPRLKALRNTLLKNRWKAQFTVDDRTFAPGIHQYASAEPGHYVLVTLPDAKLQVLISDDKSKGTFIIRNLIDPTEFTRISIDEFLAGYGATRVKWDSPEQFRKGLETEIGEQIRDPITIYPVASSYPTPLDSYPNPEAHAALQRDFDLAASAAGKASIDDLTVADFTRIKSGLVRWSFGGVAGGAAYLDRLATEFGLDADMLNRKKMNPDSEGTETDANPVEQYEFRERIMRLVLWDLSEIYRAERSAMYAKKAGHGRWHSLSVRKPRKATTKGIAEPAEPQAAQ